MAEDRVINSELNSSKGENVYEDVTGFVIAPRSADVPTLIQLHEPYGVRRVRFDYARMDRPPPIPKGVDLAKDTYVGGTVIFSTPIPKNEGYMWGVGGEYLYLQNTRRKFDSTSSFPTISPVIDAPAAAEMKGILLGESTSNSGGTGVGVSPPTNGNLETIVDQYLTDHTIDIATAFPWPFTVYPKIAFADGVLDATG